MWPGLVISKTNGTLKIRAAYDIPSSPIWYVDHKPVCRAHCFFNRNHAPLVWSRTLESLFIRIIYSTYQTKAV